MEYKVVAEFRPKIGSCQFFIKFNQTVDISEVIIASNKVLIKDSDSDILVINLGKVQLIEESISGLQIRDCAIHFRTRTEPDKVYGSYKNEVILSENNSNFKEKNYRPDIEVGKEVIISCTDCSATLTNGAVVFKRVLPLPLSFDTSDFFCHKDISTENRLSPRAEDCLYGPTVVRVPTDMVSGGCEERGSKLECKLCRSALGSVERGVAVLWRSAIKLGTEGYSPLEEFLVCAEQATLSGRAELCSSQGSVSLWAVEPRLALLVADGHTTNTSLRTHTVAKVLYSEETTSWGAQLPVQRLILSSPALVAGTSYLRSIAETHIPPEYANVNNMSVSYIFINNNKINV